MKNQQAYLLLGIVAIVGIVAILLVVFGVGSSSVSFQNLLGLGIGQKITAPSSLVDTKRTTADPDSRSANPLGNPMHDNAQSPSNQVGTCTEYRDNGIDYYTLGFINDGSSKWGFMTAMDTCARDNVTLTEYYCVNATTAGYVTYSCPEGCRKGTCRGTNPNATTLATCTDSDGGRTYGIKGTVFWMKSGVWRNGTDFCYNIVGETAPSSFTGTELAEFFCFNATHGGAGGYHCPNGCSDGACIGSGGTTGSNGSSMTTGCGNGVLEAGEQCDLGDMQHGAGNGACPKSCSSWCTFNNCIGSGTCTDTDGAYSYTVKGTATVEESDGTTISRTDSCSGKTLTEYACSGTGIVSETYLCNGPIPDCEDGRCTNASMLTPCGGTKPNGAGYILGADGYVPGNGGPTSWTYWTASSLPCTFRCASGYTYDSSDKTCKQTVFSCGGTRPIASVGTLIGASTYTTGYTPTVWTYTNTTGPCKWKCRSGFVRSGSSCIPASSGSAS